MIKYFSAKVIRDKSQPSPYVPPGLWTLKMCRKVYNAAKLWSTLSSTFAEKNCAPKLNFSAKLTDSLTQIMSLDLNWDSQFKKRIIFTHSKWHFFSLKDILNENRSVCEFALLCQKMTQKWIVVVCFNWLLNHVICLKLR